MRGAVKPYDGFSRAAGAGDTRWSGVIALHPLALFGMKEDRPFLSREMEGSFTVSRISTSCAAPVCRTRAVRLPLRRVAGRCQQLLWLSVCEGELGLLFDTLILFN
jgi:hypothetical protein